MKEFTHPQEKGLDVVSRGLVGVEIVLGTLDVNEGVIYSTDNRTRYPWFINKKDTSLKKIEKYIKISPLKKRVLVFIV